MKVEGVINFYSLNFQVKEISRPAEVLSREEDKFFEELFSLHLQTHQLLIRFKHFISHLHQKLKTCFRLQLSYQISNASFAMFFEALKAVTFASYERETHLF